MRKRRRRRRSPALWSSLPFYTIGRDREKREAEPDRGQMRQILAGGKTIKRVNEPNIKLIIIFFKQRVAQLVTFLI